MIRMMINTGLRAEDIARYRVETVLEYMRNWMDNKESRLDSLHPLFANTVFEYIKTWSEVGLTIDVDGIYVFELSKKENEIEYSVYDDFSAICDFGCPHRAVRSLLNYDQNVVRILCPHPIVATHDNPEAVFDILETARNIFIACEGF